MHLLTGDMLDKLLRLNTCLKKYTISSPDLAPSGYHLFPNFYGKRCLSNEELKCATEEWLKRQYGVFYFTGIEKLAIVTLCAVTKVITI